MISAPAHRPLTVWLFGGQSSNRRLPAMARCQYPSAMKLNWISLAVVGVAMLLMSGCKPENATTTSSTSAETATNAVAAPAKPNPGFEKLTGRWERPDGGYLLDLRAVDAEGKVDAGYFNPSPIHVAGARAYTEGGATRVFVELRDVNYPGCTYQLTYDAKSDQLFGQYYQATMQQTYEVTFARLK